MSDYKVMLLFLDGAPFRVFFPLAQKGILPNFQKIMKKNSFNLLKSTIPPVSPVAVPSLFSGRNPGKHGIFGFTYLENGNRRSYTSYNIKGEMIWDILSAANKKVILLNIPWTYPSFKVNGLLITGPPSPNNNVESYPPELISILKSKIGEYYVDLNLRNLTFEELDEEKFLEDAYLVTEAREKAMEYLMQNYDWDLFIASFTTLDRMQHMFYGYYDEESPLYDLDKRKILLNYYKKVDQIVGNIVSLIDDNTIFLVVSDHGFEYINKFVGINNMLINGGFTKSRSNIKFYTIENIENFLEKFKISYFKNMLPMKIKSILESLFPRKINYAESLCFSINASGIIINKKNITIEEYNNLKNRLIKYLYSYVDKSNNKKIIEKIYEKRDIYQGNYINRAPDLIIIFKEGYSPKTWTNNVIENFNPYKGKTNYTASHFNSISQDGICLILGNCIKENSTNEINILDITPTILHILDIPILTSIDGKVLKQLFMSNSRLYNQKIKYKEPIKIEKEKIISREDEEAILARLKKLGYIE